MNIQFFLLLVNLVCVFSEPLVKISQGILNGTVKITRYERNYSAFLGIPYAKPPIGNRRFKNPEPATGWRGIRSAHSFGNICTQNDNGLISGKDDCLFLNVYTPFLNFDSPVPGNKILPVMVWIHGGSFIHGSSNIYGSGYLLQKDVILVTINYRLGIFGFLTTGDSLAPGNFGLKDQVEALKWVRKNIRSFGGDPEKVTLFGESAGGLSVNLHVISKASNGLFQKYIQQSGSAVGPGAYRDKKDINADVKNIAKLFSCPVNNSREMINCLRKLNANDLVKNSSVAETILRFGHFIWSPTIEPSAKDAFLTEIPLSSVNNNKTKDLPFMSGTVTEEGLTFTSASFTNDVYYQTLRANMLKLMSFIAQHYKKDARKLFSDMDKFYFNNRYNSSTQEQFSTGMTKFFSDSVFFYPQIRQLEKLTPKMRNKNYFYSFGYRGKISLTTISGDTKNYGVAHADELLYLFPVTLGSFITTNANFTRVDESISKIMVDLWTSFATNGKPTSNELSNPNLWTPFLTSNSAHIQIGNIRNNRDPSVSMSNDYFTKRMNFWRKIASI